MVRLKEKLKSCGREPFPIANKNNRSIPAHTWANDNTVLLETNKQKKVIFFSFFCPYSTHCSGILGHGKHGYGLRKPSHSNYPPFPHKHANQPLTMENLDFHITKYISPLKIFTCHLKIRMPKHVFANTFSFACKQGYHSLTHIICAFVKNYYIISLKTGSTK